MITDDQITALAREYGEYVANSLDYDMCHDLELQHKLVAKGNSESAQSVLEWLSRRFCFVEKSKVQNMHSAAVAKRDALCGKEARNHSEKLCLDIQIGVLTGQVKTLESLFPEIAKEAER